jgi:hypothetical protein
VPIFSARLVLIVRFCSRRPLTALCPAVYVARPPRDDVRRNWFGSTSPPAVALLFFCRDLHPKWLRLRRW